MPVSFDLHDCLSVRDLSVFENQEVDFNIVISKKYIFGHSGEQNVFKFLIYIWSFSTVPGLQLLKPLEFPVVRI